MIFFFFFISQFHHPFYQLFVVGHPGPQLSQNSISYIFIIYTRPPHIILYNVPPLIFWSFFLTLSYFYCFYLSSLWNILKLLEPLLYYPWYLFLVLSFLVTLLFHFDILLSLLHSYSVLSSDPLFNTLICTSM